MSKRFNKENLTSHIQQTMDNLVSTFGFDIHDGYAQVQMSNTTRIMAWGQFTALRDLLEQIEYKSL